MYMCLSACNILGVLSLQNKSLRVNSQRCGAIHVHPLSVICKVEHYAL